MKFFIASALVKLGYSTSNLAHAGASDLSWEREKGTYLLDGGNGRGQNGDQAGDIKNGGPAKNRLENVLSNGIREAFKNNYDVGVLSKQPSNVTYSYPTSVEECEEFVECEYGYAGGETCEEACDGDCCVGYAACVGFTGKVCKDQVSCNGDYGCFYGNIGEVNMGCEGPFACTFTGLNYGSVGKVVNGCRSGYGCCACYGVSAFGGEVTEIVNSCQGDVTCVLAGYQGGKIGSIYNSCQGDYYACYRTGASGTVANIADSCQGLAACDGLAEYYGQVGDMTGACKATGACFYAASGGNVAEFVDACNGDYGCYDLANNGLVGKVKVACNAENACVAAGSEESGDIPSGIIECCNQEGECEGASEDTLPDECLTADDPTPSPTPSKSGKKAKTGKSGKSSKGSKNGTYENNMYGREESSSMSLELSTPSSVRHRL